MNAAELFEALGTSATVEEVETAIAAFETAHPGTKWVPVGRENNRGTIEASSDPGRSLIERLTNGFDAVLESEYIRHQGRPECQTPREAAEAWLGIRDGSLSALSQRERQKLADRVSIRLLPGEGKSSRLVIVEDRGNGILPDQMPKTILSLSETNKTTKRYLVGAYGQGGSSTFAVSRYTVIASRNLEHPTVGFTIVRYNEPAADDDAKIGNYVFLALDGGVLTVDVPVERFPTGTRIQHFGYDLSDYNSPVGPGSVYGLLNAVLFDPILPMWLDNRVNHYRRVIKGSRNALNGAIDEGDEDRRGPQLSHSVPMFFVNIGEAGTIGIEYWVLETTEKNKRPIAAFINPSKSIVLTLHGQSHAELSSVLVRKNAELPYLRLRLIVHVDCNRLTGAAKRLLFVSNREEARRGQVYSRIEEEVVKALQSDEDLERLNNDARNRDRSEQDQEAQSEMRGEVAKLLKLQGMNVELEGSGGVGVGPGSGRQRRRRGPRRPPVPIEIHEPPTYVRIVWDEDEPIRFHPDQRRYLRIITDADSKYHNATDISASRFNFVVTGTGVRFIGTTPLTGGRLRAIATASATAQVGEAGSLRVELSVPGQPVLAAEHPFEIEARPDPANNRGRRITMPEIEWREVFPGHDDWESVLNWPENPAIAASDSTFEGGKLIVWWSNAFPNYAAQARAFEQRDPALAASFTNRYKVWLAVHSLLIWQEESEDNDSPATADQNVEAQETREQLERCRVAAMSVMFAAREIKDSKEDTAVEE